MDVPWPLSLFAPMQFLKHFTIYLLTLSTLGSTLTVPLVYLDFEMRRDYIADTLCINREEPITVCRGSCYLELNLENKSQNQEAAPVSHGNLLTFFIQQLGAAEIEPTTPSVIDRLLTKHAEGKPIKISISVFHPPNGLV